MACKFNTYKSIKQRLVSPSILFTAAYLLFSAEICTSSPKDKSRKGIGNASLAIDQVNQTDKIEALDHPKDDPSYNDLPPLDPVLAIDPAEEDALFDTDTTDTETTTPSVEPLEPSVAKNEAKASVVDTASSIEQQDSFIKDDALISPFSSFLSKPLAVNNNISTKKNIDGYNNNDDVSPETQLPNADLKAKLQQTVMDRRRAVGFSDSESDSESDSDFDRHNSKNTSEEYQNTRECNKEKEAQCGGILKIILQPNTNDKNTDDESTDDETQVYDGRNNDPEWD